MHLFDLCCGLINLFPAPCAAVGDQPVSAIWRSVEDVSHAVAIEITKSHLVDLCCRLIDRFPASRAAVRDFPVTSISRSVEDVSYSVTIEVSQIHSRPRISPRSINLFLLASTTVRHIQ